MTTCDDYQLAFEMQLHGATPTISPDEIAAHIPVCAPYVAITTSMETGSPSCAAGTGNMFVIGRHSGFRRVPDAQARSVLALAGYGESS